MAKKKNIQTKTKPKSTPKRDLWDRQKNENVRAFEMFVNYRSDPNRTHKRTAEHFGCRPNNIDRIAAKNEWTKRIKAWTDHLNHIAVKTEEDETIAAKKRMIKNSVIIQKAAMKPIIASQKITHNAYNEMKPDRLAGVAKEAVTSVVAASKLELTLRGEASESSQSTVEGTLGAEVSMANPFKGLPLDELKEEFKKRASKMGIGKKDSKENND